MASLSKAETVIHPIRLRIVSALTGRSLTPKQIARAVPDVPTTSLYRHLRILLEGGVIEVASQRSVNGISESSYTLRASAAHFDREEFAAISPEDHQRFYAAFVSALVSTANRYFEDADADPVRDGMTYFMASLHLTDEQRRAVRLELLDLCQRHAGSPGPGTRPTQLGVSLTPDLFNDPFDKAP